MAISNPVRKMLWAKSGNRCAFCQKELTKILFGVITTCGEECHIVSQKEKGPRHRNLKDYDQIDNLILLCQEHHKMIDDNPQQFSEKYLKNLKAKHESLSTNFVNSSSPVLLTEVIEAKDLTDDLADAEQYVYDFPTENKEDFPLFSEFFEIVKDFDVLDEKSDVEKIKYIAPCLKQIQEKNYVVASGQSDNFGKFQLKTSFVFILTKNQFEQCFSN